MITLPPTEIVGGWDFRFSNFAPAPVVDEYGIGYPTVEHAYQAAKALSPHKRLAIAAMAKPGDAKRAGQRIDPLRSDWDAVRLGVMLGFLRQKFVPGSAYAANLLLTEATVLCETNHWHDQFFGDCICAEHAGARGENWLGRLLMVVRSELALGSWRRAAPAWWVEPDAPDSGE